MSNIYELLQVHLAEGFTFCATEADKLVRNFGGPGWHGGM